MSRFQKEEFWRDELIVTQDRVERIFWRVEDLYGPISEEEIAEALIREVLQNEGEFADAKIYSPEQTYIVGEKLAFIRQNGIEYAEVLKIIQATSLQCGPYNKIYVRFKGKLQWGKYASDCPDLPARFSRPKLAEREMGRETAFVTPGQLVTRFGHIVLPEIRRALSEDARFVAFDHEWWLADEVVPINVEAVAQILRNARKSLTPHEILNELFPEKANIDNSLTYLFSLNVQLDSDRERRFNGIEREGKCFWALQAAVPPARSQYTVTNSALREGYIEIRPGFRQMLDFFELGPQLAFTVYGDYELQGDVDEATNRVYGPGIATWYLENEVRPGDTVYVKCPQPNGTNLRLYTADHEPSQKKPRGEVERESQRVYLRHQIYSLFIQRGKFTHYNKLAELLSSKLADKISLSSVEAVLSKERHVFGRLRPSRGLWGLREWLDDPYDYRVDFAALLLDIGELQLVWKTLYENSHPMDAKEIAMAISGAYGISPSLLIEANFIDPQDDRLLRLANGKWALAAWTKEWRQRFHQIGNELNRIEGLKETFNDLRFKLGKAAYSVNIASKEREGKANDLLQMTQKRDYLVDEIEQFKGRKTNLEKINGNLTCDGVRALANIEKFRKHRRRHLVLAVCAGAIGLVMGATHALALGASIGVVSLILLCFTARAHKRCTKLSSLAQDLRRERSDVESKATKLCADMEAIDLRINKHALRLESVNRELAKCDKTILTWEQKRHRIVAYMGVLEHILLRSDASALQAERDQLAELLAEGR